MVILNFIGKIIISIFAGFICAYFLIFSGLLLFPSLSWLNNFVLFFLPILFLILISKTQKFQNIWYLGIVIMIISAIIILIMFMDVGDSQDLKPWEGLAMSFIVLYLFGAYYSGFMFAMFSFSENKKNHTIKNKTKLK